MPRRLVLTACACVVAWAAACSRTTVPGPAARAEADAGAAPRAVLRVCADPNNLPFSNARLEGFENRLADLLAADLGAEVRYTWWAQRRGFLRHSLNARTCDVVMGLPFRMDGALTTRPYYRSTYVTVARRESGVHISSLDDRRLHSLKLGVPLVGDDGANAPPAHALSRRGVVGNVVGYSVYGNYAEDNPPSRLIVAVADGEIDLALAWGPLAGYFAARQSVPLDVTPLSASDSAGAVPLVFDISMGVRRGDDALRSQLDTFIIRRAGAIADVLDAYHVPRLPLDLESR